LVPRTARNPDKRKTGRLDAKTAQGFLVGLVADQAMRRFTGRLQVSSQKILRRLFFVQGRVVGFWSDHPEDDFGRRFVQAGHLDAEALRWAQDHLTPEERIEEALVAGSMVNWEQVALEQSRHLESGVDSLVRMKTGEWEIKEHSDLAARLQHCPLPEANLHASVWRGVRKSISADVALQSLSESGGAFRCTDSLPVICKALPSLPDGLEQALGEGNTLEQLFARVRDNSGELFQLVWYLENAGAISRGSGISSEFAEEVQFEKGEDVPVSEWTEKEVPENTGMSWDRADDLMKIGAYAAALSFLEDARFAEPNNADVLAALGWAHFKSTGGENFEEAEEFVDLALTFDSKNPKGLEYRARIALEKGETDKARNAVELLAKINPKNRWAKNQMRQLGAANESKRGFGFWRRK
jgi:hypothetical protein